MPRTPKPADHQNIIRDVVTAALNQTPKEIWDRILEGDDLPRYCETLTLLGQRAIQQVEEHEKPEKFGGES